STVDGRSRCDPRGGRDARKRGPREASLAEPVPGGGGPRRGGGSRADQASVLEPAAQRHPIHARRRSDRGSVVERFIQRRPVVAGGGEGQWARGRDSASVPTCAR